MRKLTRVFMVGVAEPVTVAMEFDAWVRTYLDGLNGKEPVVQAEVAAGGPVLIALDHVAYSIAVED